MNDRAPAHVKIDELLAARREDALLAPPLTFLRRLWRLNQALERLSTRMERTIGVTAQQRLALRCVGRMPGILPGQLADVLHVDPGTVSAMLKRLEKKGLVRRVRDKSDARRVALSLTAAGRALDRPTAGTVENAVSRLLAELSESERRAAERTLARLTDLLDGTPVQGARRVSRRRKRTSRS